MNEIIEIENIAVENMIYEIRGVQVMLSSDVAKLYQVETKRVNEVIKRNINRFPESFCFRLTEREFYNLRSQFATSSENNYGGVRYLPYVLTEQGIMMLSGLLKSDIAVKVNVQIIDAFVKMRRYFANTISSNEMLINYENRILRLEKTLDNFNEKKEMNKIFFEGELYDAYSLILDIFNKSKEEIIIIDNYAGKELLDILKKIEKHIIIVSKNIDDTLKKKYECQYNNITFINNNTFHDRFIIIDKDILFSCGASFKDLGKKCFAINKFDNKEYLIRLLKVLNYISEGLTKEVSINIDFVKKHLADTIYKQAILEGVATTLSDTENIIEGGKVNSMSSEDILKIVNLKHSWEFILNKNVILTPTNYSILCMINKLVEEGFYYNAGTLRTVPVKIGGTSWAPDIPIESDVKDDIRSIVEQRKDNIDIAIELLLYVVKKQMFIDGNKRTSVIFANHYLISKGKGLIVIPTEKVEEYKKMLIDFYESNDDKVIFKFIKDTCYLKIN